MKKYLISIETDDSQRLMHFFDQSTFAPFRAEFHKVGIIGNDLPLNTYFDLAVSPQKKALSPGELGCTLSHLAALKDFVASGADYAIVFEDDVIAKHDIDLNVLYQDVQALVLEKCLFLSLGGIESKINNQVMGKLEARKLLNKNVLKLHPFCFDKLSGAYAYIVDQAMANSLIEYHQIPHVWDHWGGIAELNQDVHFYATHVFDHPDISENTTLLSHLEDERAKLNHQLKIKKPLTTRLPQSLMKRWLKLFYQRYQD